MNNYKIHINKKFQDNKYLVGFIAVAIILFLLVIVEMNRLSKTKGDSNQNAISNSVSIDSKQNTIKQIIAENKINSYEDVKNNVSNGTERIETFILLCNQKKYQVAYDMLSDDCKSILYPTLQDFLESYYNPIFKSKRVYEITSFKNNTYLVNYYIDAITTGVADTEGVIDYITLTDDGKINISSYIGSQSLNINSKDEYFDIVIKKRDTYVDYEEYTMSFKNNTYADIYLNNYENSNVYVKNNKQQKFDLDNSESTDFDYLIYAKSEEEFKFRFKMKYQVGRYSNSNEYVDLIEMCFGNVKIVNQEYFDNSTLVANPATGSMEPEKKRTNYPGNITYRINFTK